MVATWLPIIVSMNNIANIFGIFNQNFFEGFEKKTIFQRKITIKIDILCPLLLIVTNCSINLLMLVKTFKNFCFGFLNIDV